MMTTLERYDAAMRLCANDHARWCALNRRAAELREGATVYQPYPYRNKALVKALYVSWQEGLLTRADFTCCLSNVRGEWH